MAAPADKKKIRFEPSATGTPRVVTRGQRIHVFEDIYHRVLGMPWWRFFAYVGLTWIAINFVFAILYASHPGCVAGATPGDLEDAFYFSVQTFATIGYGAMAPATRFGHMVVVFEALVGTLGVALVTGATFAKFARPTARVLFGSKAVVHMRDGVPHLVFRLANWRSNVVVEGRLQVGLLLRQRTREGDVIRVPVELPLVRDRTALFSLTWVPMHRIDEKSPLWGGLETRDRLRAENAELYLSFSGMDDTIGQTIQARHRYGLDQIVYNARFADVLTIEADGRRIIDYGRFHDVELLGRPEELVWDAAAATT